MVEMFFSGILLVFALLSFQNVYRSNGVYRCYLGLYKGIAERNVMVVDKKGEYGLRPYFYLPSLRLDVASYFASDLAPYCLSYDYSVSPYPEILPLFSVEGDGPIALDFCVEVKISFQAKISDFKTIKKTALFAVERTDNEPK